MARMRIGIGLALLAACVAPSAASAATGSVTLDGGRLVISDGDAGRRAYIGMWYTGELMIDAGELDPIPASCARESETNNTVLCPLPAAIRLDLGGGDDMSSVSDAIPAAVAIEVYGGAGNDLYEDRSGEFAGVLDGGAGNDKIEGYTGADMLTGGPGDDKLDGGAGADVVRGGEGDDELEGDEYQAASADVIDGGPGFDIMTSTRSPDSESTRRRPSRSTASPTTAGPARATTLDRRREDHRARRRRLRRHGRQRRHLGGGRTSPAARSTINGLGGNDELTGSDRSGDDRRRAPATTSSRAASTTTPSSAAPARTASTATAARDCSAYECTVPFGDDTIDARDGEVDTVECGIGNDTAQADAIDTVANCETVTRSAAGPAPTTAPAATPAQARRARWRARPPPASPGRAACAACWRASSSRSSSARPRARSSRSCAPTLARPSDSGCAAAP